MKVGIVSFLFGLAFIHMPVADSLEADSEKPDDDSLQKRFQEELHDGIMFKDDNSTVFDVNITRDNEMLLGHIAIFMKSCTAKECSSDQCYKFGDHIICMSFLIYNLKADDDSLQKRPREELPDGIMFRDDNTTVFDVDITRDNEMLLGHVAIFMKNSTAKECHSDQCYKFGDRIICMSFSLYSLKADSEEPDDDSLQKRSREELPDGIMFRDNTTVFDVNITRDNEMLLGHVAIFMKHCTAKECNSDQCYKFGDRIICMSFSIYDKDEFFNKIKKSKQLLD